MFVYCLTWPSLLFVFTFMFQQHVNFVHVFLKVVFAHVQACADCLDSLHVFYSTQHYQWMDLQNIYYKDKKFSVEVYASNKYVYPIV